MISALHLTNIQRSFTDTKSANPLISKIEYSLLTLSDIQGRMISQYPIKSGKNSLQLPAELATGIYILQCRSANGDVAVRKIVKQ
jgi:hypothetical protein